MQKLFIINVITEKMRKSKKYHRRESHLAKPYAIDNLKYQVVSLESRTACCDNESSKI